MKIRTRKLGFAKNAKTSKIIFTSCWHVGNPACREKHIIDLVERCASENIPWIMLGDIIEAIAPVDPRFHMETHQESVLAQIEHAAALMSPGVKQCWGLHVGNHEDKISAKFGDITGFGLRLGCKWACKSDAALNKMASNLHLGGACFTEVECPSGRLIVYTAHSRLSCAGSGTSDPDRDGINRQIRLRRKLSPWQADLKVIGHGHTNIIAPPVMTSQLASRTANTAQAAVVLRHEWCAMAASMFVNYDNSESYPDYAELAMYPPTDIGYIEAEIDRFGRVVEVRAINL